MLHFKELVKSIEDLREKREELNRQILKDRKTAGRGRETEQ